LVVWSLFLAPAATQDILPYQYSIDDLPNGLRLVTVPTGFPDLVTTYVVVSVGSRNEIEEGKSGFAHFFEHMMFRGTENYTSAQQAAFFKKIGADRNAYTTDDYTAYHTTFSKEDLDGVLMMEADRFRNLRYPEHLFRTEAMAVLGEYNKNSASPFPKLIEVLRETTFREHTYKHTTMGFLRDIEAMPDQFAYSRQFFDQYYRPEYTTILVVGDVNRARTLELVEKYWGDWEHGTYHSVVVSEPRQEVAKTSHVPWPAPIQPWIMVAFRGPAFSSDAVNMPTIDVLMSLAFGVNSELYKKLYVREQKVDLLTPYNPDATDPYLVGIVARVRDPDDVGYVREEILRTCAEYADRLVDPDELQRVKDNLRYSFAANLDSSEAIAGALAGYIGRERTPEAVNKVYKLYAEVTAEDVRAMAAEYFETSQRTIATLAHGDLPANLPAPEPPPLDEHSVLLPSDSPLVTFRMMFMVGSGADPKGKEGLASLAASLLTEGGTAARSYEQIVEDLFPMAAFVGASVDKEMTVISATVHRENLQRFYGILREMLWEPGFREEDFKRVVANTISYLDDGLRRSDDEETGKEVLYQEIYRDHRYGHNNAGAIEALGSITLQDVRDFYDRYYDATHLIVGLSGDYPEELPERILKDARRGAVGEGPTDIWREPWFRRGAPVDLRESRMTIVQKTTRATGLHIGFPIEVTRRHPDWVALWLVRSYFGEHRSENSYLYQRIREIRGLNYGDYAYIEYFPRGGAFFQPPPNLARTSQIFQIWIRPVPPENGPFALKAVWYELDKLVREGLSEPAFQATRTYLSKYVNLLVKTQDRRLGYAMDSRFYGIAEFAPSVVEQLAALTVGDVNRVLRKHLRADRLQFVVVTEDAVGFRDAVLGSDATPITYQSLPAREILAEDAVIEKLRLPLERENVRIVPVSEVFLR